MNPENTFPKRALVISDSNIDQDSRVRNQVKWLVQSGWMTDTLGQGLTPRDSNGTHYSLGQRTFYSRMFSYLFLPNRLRFNWLIASKIPEELSKRYREYDFIVVNEIDLLPWIVESGPRLLKNGADQKIHLDLHEFALSQGVGMVWKLLFSRYRTWLASFIPRNTFRSRSVVAKGIADLYAKKYGIPKPTTIMSCPEELNITPSEVDAQNIKLIHHGKADLDRGLEILIDSFEYLDSRFSLTFMLVESGNALKSLKERAAKYAGKISFIEPVSVAEVSRTINDFDIELIVFPPITENLRLALPNKFFEAIQGRLGLVIGNSPSMLDLIEKWSNGKVVDGWGAHDLASCLNSISVEEVIHLKNASNRAAKTLNSEFEGKKFLEFANR